MRITDGENNPLLLSKEVKIEREKFHGAHQELKLNTWYKNLDTNKYVFPLREIRGNIYRYEGYAIREFVDTDAIITVRNTSDGPFYKFVELSPTEVDNLKVSLL